MPGDRVLREAGLLPANSKCKSFSNGAAALHAEACPAEAESEPGSDEEQQESKRLATF